MKCPHCLVEINPNFTRDSLRSVTKGSFYIEHMSCPNPNCRNLIINLIEVKSTRDGTYDTPLLIYPTSSSHPPAPLEVDKHIAQDYTEACLVLVHSPKASAALSRRCLQNILREKAGIKHGDLFKEIQEVINEGKLPSHLSESIDAIRQIGNFAAHPIKSKSSGEIVDVEPGEAEWSLDVLESLFDFYYVQPTILKKKREELNTKLQDAGKHPMK